MHGTVSPRWWRNASPSTLAQLHLDIPLHLPVTFLSISHAPTSVSATLYNLENTSSKLAAAVFNHRSASLNAAATLMYICPPHAQLLQPTPLNAAIMQIANRTSRAQDLKRAFKAVTKSRPVNDGTNIPQAKRVTEHITRPHCRRDKAIASLSFVGISYGSLVGRYTAKPSTNDAVFFAASLPSSAWGLRVRNLRESGYGLRG